MTSRSARFRGTIVSGSKDAFSARQPTITHAPRERGALPPGADVYSSACSDGLGLGDHGQPSVTVGDPDAHDAEILFLDGRRDGAAPGVAYRQPVDAEYGRDFDRRAGEEQFVGH